MAQLTDIHCHVLPPGLHRPPGAAWEDLWFAACHASESRRFADAAQALAAAREAGLERVVICGWPFRDPGLLREVNDYVAAEAAGMPGQVLGLATVNPASPGAGLELERCRGLGLVGLGEINADAQHFDLEFAGELRRTLLSCGEMGWPVLLHSSEPVGHDYAGKGTASPGRLWPFLEAWLEQDPRSRVCLAHLGGGLPFYGYMPEVAALCRRLWFDTAAIPYLYRPSVLGWLGSNLGADRLCFGSDFPLLAPRRYLPFLEVLGERERDAVCRGGPAGWLGG